MNANTYANLPSGELATRAMLVSLNISVWTARRLDKKVTSEVHAAHNVDNEAGAYRKSLLPQDAPLYKAVVTAANAARDIHYTNTLPWSNDGSRILPAANFLPYADMMRTARETFESAVAAFIMVYPQCREDARLRLNGMFSDDDYPNSAKIASKFGMKQSTLPLPSASDFRVSMADSDLDRIRQEIEQSTRLAAQDAMKDAYTRLATALGHMAETLADPKKFYKDTLFGNLAELCDVLPRLNMTNDKALDAATDAIRAKILTSKPDDARKNSATRGRLAQDAQDILDTMAAFI